jgi:putative PIN family toxin of toxin-antitoxin system
MKAERLRLVIDSNIWISAALSSGGNPARLIKMGLNHAVPEFSPETFQELEKRIWKPKFDRYLSIELRRSMLHDIDAVSFWVDIPSRIAGMSFSRDPDDDKFIHTALAAEAPYLVSGNQDLLSIT